MRSFTNKGIETPKFVFVPSDGEMENLIRLALLARPNNSS